MARNTIVLAKQLGMRIIAEGVETVEQALFLRKYGFATRPRGFYTTFRPWTRANLKPSALHGKCFWVDPRLQARLPDAESNETTDE